MIGAALERNGFFLGPEKTEKLRRFVELIRTHNAAFGLVSASDARDAGAKHIVDSVAGMRYLPDSGRVVDIGSGAGLPGIPLAIAAGARLEFALLDSRQKKTAFQEKAVRELRLSNAHALNARAEAEGRANRAGYDCAVSRATAPMPVLLEYALPLVRVGGTVVMYEGRVSDADLPLNALKELGGELTAVDRFVLDGKYERCFVAARKIFPTPEKYPRPRNRPRKNPIA